MLLGIHPDKPREGCESESSCRSSEMAATLDFSSSRARAGSRRCRWSGASGPLVLFLIVVYNTPVAEPLEMTIFRSPKTVLLNADVTLECKVTDFGTSLLDLSNVGVQWMYGSQKKEIYTFNAGTTTPKRSGVKLSEAELKKGVASLYLPNIQLSEAGEYTCIVLVTPDKVEKTSRIEVLAKPKVLLSTKHITVLNGTEKSVWCDATEFYPEKHEIFWEKISGGKAERLERHVRTGAAVSNNDGTYNVSSNIIIEPTLKDDGNAYKCTVRHQSLPDELSQEVKLTVVVPEPKSTSTAAVAIYALLGVFGLLFAAGLLAYLWIFLKVPPKITGCSDHQVLKHLEEEVVTWTVSSFRPSQVTIVIYAKRKQEDKCQLLKCSDKDWNENYSNHVSTNGPDCNEARILMQSDVEDASFKPRISEFTTNRFKISCVEVSIRIYPDISLDDGAELSIEVQHRALKEPMTKTLTLEVVGVPPKVLNILMPRLIKDKQPVALSCSVSGFKPRPLSIIWQQKRKNEDLEELVQLQLDNTTIIHNNNEMNLKAKHYISEEEHEDKTYSIASVLEIVPDIQQDQDSQYLCSILHHSTKDKQEKSVTLSITAPPKLGNIQCEAAKPIAEEPMILSCQISSFYPKDITVKWLKAGSEIQNSEVNNAVIGQDELYHFTANVKVTLTSFDAETKYTCQVEHVSLSKPIETHWVAGEVILLPKISEIKADPPSPEIGKPLTLSCTAYGFYPEGNQIFWFKDSGKIQNPKEVGIVTDASKEDSNGLYSRSSRWTFRPTATDHGKEFKMQILHSETSSKPVTSRYCLKLRGVVDNQGGSKDKPYKQVGRSGAETENKPYKQDGRSGAETEKNVDKQDGSNQAKSEEVPQKVSEIKCLTKNPKIGEPVTLSCVVNECVLDEAHIIWYRDAYPFDEKEFVTNTPFENPIGFTTELTYIPKANDKHHIQLQLEFNLEEHMKQFDLILS